MLELSLLDNVSKWKVSDRAKPKANNPPNTNKTKTCPWPIGVKGETSSSSHGNLYSPALTTSSAACSQWYHSPYALLQKALFFEKEVGILIQSSLPLSFRAFSQKTPEALLVAVGLFHAYIHFSYGSWSAWTDMSLCPTRSDVNPLPIQATKWGGQRESNHWSEARPDASLSHQ